MTVKKETNLVTKKNVTAATVIAIIFFLIMYLTLAVQQRPTSTYKSKAAEITPKPIAQTPIPPDLIGKIVSLQDINSGNTVLIISGTSKKDYLEALKVNKPPQEQKYLLILTPKTRVTKVADTALLTKSTLKKDMNVYIYTTTDLAVGLKVINTDK